MKSTALFCAITAIIPSISTPVFASKEVQILNATVVQTLNTPHKLGERVNVDITLLTELEDFDTHTKSPNYTQGYSWFEKSVSAFSRRFCYSFAKSNDLFINQSYSTISNDITISDPETSEEPSPGTAISTFSHNVDISLNAIKDAEYEGVTYNCSSRLFGSKLDGEKVKNGQIEMTITRSNEADGEVFFLPVMEKYLYPTF
jgi:hypothetical protein